MKSKDTKHTPPIALNRWGAQIGVTAVTLWRWRKLGWIETVNLAGRQYITAEAQEKFNQRATAGEFAKEHKTPKRSQSVVV